MEPIKILVTNDDELLQALAKNGMVKGRGGEKVELMDADSKEGIRLSDKHNIQTLPQAIKGGKFCKISYEGEGAVISCPEEQ